MGTDIKLAGDVDKPLLGRLKVWGANTPRAINNIDKVIYSCAAAYTHKYTHAQLSKTNTNTYTENPHFRLVVSIFSCFKFQLSWYI